MSARAAAELHELEDMGGGDEDSLGESALDEYLGGARRRADSSTRRSLTGDDGTSAARPASSAGPGSAAQPPGSEPTGRDGGGGGSNTQRKAREPTRHLPGFSAQGLFADDDVADGGHEGGRGRADANESDEFAF